MIVTCFSLAVWQCLSPLTASSVTSVGLGPSKPDYYFRVGRSPKARKRLVNVKPYADILTLSLFLFTDFTRELYRSEVKSLNPRK